MCVQASEVVEVVVVKIITTRSLKTNKEDHSEQADALSSCVCVLLVSIYFFYLVFFFWFCI